MAMTVAQIGMTEQQVQALVRPLAVAMHERGVFEVHVNCSDLSRCQVRLYPKRISNSEDAEEDDLEDDDFDEDDEGIEEDDDWWEDQEWESPHLEYLARTAADANRRR